MIMCGNWPVGVCSWSLQTDVAGVAAAMTEMGLNTVHLDIGPACGDNPDAYIDLIRQQDWTISSTMLSFEQEDYSSLETIKATGGIAPDDCWEVNKQRFLKAVRATAALNIRFLSTHIGFLDHSDAEYAKKFYDRVRTMADAAAAENIVVLLETGQESAEDLKAFLQEMNHPSLGVNFDPANMILYDRGDPIEALKVLAPWIKHVHIKDANRTTTPGTWGSEEVWGTGQVGGEAFLTALKEIGYDGVLAIEREAGNSRKGDVKIAIEKLCAFSG